MAKIKFQLRPPKEDSSSIYFRLSYGAFEIIDGKKKYRPLDYYISESINPKFWNAKDGRAIRTRSFPQYSEFNARLDNVENEVNNIIRRLLNDNIALTENIIRQEIDLLFSKESSNQTKTMELMPFIDYFIETIDRAEGTKKSYRRVEKDLQEFEQKDNTKLTFDKIDIDFYNDFINYLKSKKYAPNTIGTRIKVLKTFMSEAYERSLHNNLDFRKKAFSKPSEDTRAVYLNDTELKTIFNLDLSRSKSYDNVRDWFLIASYTGLRFSDLERLSKDNIKNNLLEIRTKKTDTIVAIPLHPIVKSILEKHEYDMPRIISNQKFNEYIKDVVKLAEISEEIVIEKTAGNIKEKKKESKHKLISAHTARRSFATNAYLAGVPTIQLMKMTGHKTESAFLQYIKISEKENAEKLQLHPFFMS